MFVGGILGCIFSGFITEYTHPKYAFLIYSFMGLAVSVCAMYLTKESEEESEVYSEVQYEGPPSLIKEVKVVYQRIKKAVLLPEIYQILIYIIINGFISPDFESYKYFFLMDEI